MKNNLLSNNSAEKDQEAQEDQKDRHVLPGELLWETQQYRIVLIIPGRTYR